MQAGGRLALYGAALAVAFSAAFGLAGAVVPAGFVNEWKEGITVTDHGQAHGGGEQNASAQPAQKGLALEANGLILSTVRAPVTVGTPGELNFQIFDRSGAVVTEFATTHDRDMHLIVVRSDGAQFRHVHPVLDTATGTWTLPWTWDEAGRYRVYADFTPAGQNALGVTLTRTVEVAGAFAPVVPALHTTAEVDGFTVTLNGDLTAGSPSKLTLTVNRGGAPVTALQPYLGAFGHLVALRQGDLAFLHVHPEGNEPVPGAVGGPTVEFAATAPTAGRYLLYLDFQVDGQVRTAGFVVDAGHGAGAAPEPDAHAGGH